MRSFLTALGFFVCIYGHSQCCNDSICKAKAKSLAADIIPFLEFVGNTTTDDPAVNNPLLEAAFRKDPVRFNAFKSLIYELVRFNDPDDQNSCFSSFLTPEQSISVGHWMVYFRDLKNPVSFPSPEFCSGLRTRFEIGQGAWGFLENDMAYLGSVKGLLAYTFGKKQSCGNHWRLLGGPAFFLKNNTPYIALTSRMAYRLKDLMIKNPPVFLGNWNIYGEYTDNFDGFSYAGIGTEAQLGRFGLNLTVHRDFDEGHYGFLIGIFIGNKKKK